MAYSERKKQWDKDNTLIFSVKFFHATDGDIIRFMDRKVDKSKGIGRGTVIKQALTRWMKEEQLSADEIRAYELDEMED